jgi:hypothetical protein
VRTLTGGWQQGTFKCHAPQEMAVVKMHFGTTVTVRAEHLKVLPAPKTLLEAVQEVQKQYEQSRDTKEKQNVRCF